MSLGAVFARDPVAQPGVVALEDTQALLAVKERFDAHLLLRLRDVEQRGLHEPDALPTIGTWVDAQSTSVNRRMVALARRLDRLPTVSRELLSGRLSMAAAQRVAIDVAPGGSADDDPRVLTLIEEVTGILRSGRSEVERVEAAFVALAQRVESRLLRGCLDQLVDALLPVQLEERAEKTHDKRARGVSSSTHPRPRPQRQDHPAQRRPTPRPRRLDPPDPPRLSKDVWCATVTFILARVRALSHGPGTYTQCGVRLRFLDGGRRPSPGQTPPDTDQTLGSCRAGMA